MKVPCTISYIGLVRKPCGKSPAAFGAAGALTSMPPGSLPGQHVLNDLRVLSTVHWPSVPLGQWTFTVKGAVTQSRTWNQFTVAGQGEEPSLPPRATCRT
jgi:hypothetical protein